MPGTRAGGRKGGGFGKSTRHAQDQPPQLAYLTVVADICTLEADPEAVSVFFKSNAAITVRVDVVCGRDVLATARSRTLMNFEDDVNCKVKVALSKEQYEHLVLENTPADANGGGVGGNHLRFSVMSIGQEASSLDQQSLQEHAGASQPIPFLDQLDGLCLPTSEPEHPREYELRLQKKPQALLMVKLWVDASSAFEGVDAGFAAVEEKGSHADVESVDGTNQTSSNGSDTAATAESSSSRRQQQHQPGKVGARDETALERVARQLGIDAAHEPELLWIAREALETPPPPFWVEVPVTSQSREEKMVDEEDESSATMEFMNLRTGVRSRTNPIINYFEQLTAKERQRIGDAISVEQHYTNGDSYEVDDGRPRSEPAPETTWVRLGDGSQPGSRYFFNFQSREKIEHKADLPQHAQVVEALPSLVEPYRASGGGDLGDGTSVRTLTFYTWWKEGTVDGMKRFTTKIVYDLATQNFIVTFQDSHDPVTLSEVPGRFGPINQWDLRVTGVINLLGRPTTLMQCDESTLKWLDHRARRIVKLRAAFKTEIMKYDKLMKGKHYIHPAFRKDGKTDLRTIIRQIEELFHRLAKYRASLAKKMLAGFEEVVSLAILRTGK